MIVATAYAPKFSGASGATFSSDCPTQASHPMMKYLLPLLMLITASASALAAEKRPNILFVFADDWGRYASAYAKLDGPGGINDVVRTPHFDRVAREGVLFRSAFVSAPSCT